MFGLKQSVLVVCALVFAAFCTVAGGTPALASCNPNRTPTLGTWQAGWSTGTGIYDIQSNLLEYDPWVYGHGQPSAWVMLDNSGGCGACYLSQVGWTKFGDNDGNGGGTRYTFYAYTLNGQYYERDNPGQTVGNYTTYRVYWFIGGGNNYYAYFYVNGSYYANSIVDFQPNDGTMAGEIGNLASQMPGGYYSPEYFKTSQKRVSPSTSWQSFSGTTYSSSSQYFKSDYESSTQLGIWDWNCAN
jgi:hypothetical protein